MITTVQTMSIAMRFREHKNKMQQNSEESKNEREKKMEVQREQETEESEKARQEAEGRPVARYGNNLEHPAVTKAAH